MPHPTRRRVQVVICVEIVALVAAACGQSASEPKPANAKPTIKSVSHPLPAVVNGVPLLDLATHALGAAEAYSVSKPENVRAVVTTQAALYAQVPASGGATGPEYVVVLSGRFSTGGCPSTTTTDPLATPVSTMVLELPIPLTSGATTGVAVGVGTPNMTRLGQVYKLDPYIRSLAGVPIRIGPLPNLPNCGP